MQIYHLRLGKVVEADDLTVTYHQEDDGYGEMTTRTVIEFDVIGNTRTWRDFLPIDDFKLVNPNIDTEKLKTR